MALNYRERFPAYNFPHPESSDKGLDASHYEQGMFVEGELTYEGRKRTIKCLGHRDHTWGFRDETRLAGWNWAAIQCENSTWNLTQVRRLGSQNSEVGFVSFKEKNIGVSKMEVIEVEHNQNNEPQKSKYRVVLEDEQVFHVTATRFMPMPLADPRVPNIIAHENFSHFVIEETGETGVGVDEHMMISVTT